MGCPLLVQSIRLPEIKISLGMHAQIKNKMIYVECMQCFERIDYTSYGLDLYSRHNYINYIVSQNHDASMKTASVV
jgi:hypothetical protein